MTLTQSVSRMAETGKMENVHFVPCPSREETEMLIMKAATPAFIVDSSDMAKEFVHSCLIRKSHLRPSAWQLQRYSWIKVGQTLSDLSIGGSGLMTSRLVRCLVTCPSGKLDKAS